MSGGHSKIFYPEWSICKSVVSFSARSFRTMEHIEREIFFVLQVKFAAEKMNATLQTRMGIKTQTGSVQTTTEAHTAKSTGTWWQSQSVNGHGTSSTPGKTIALLPVVQLWPLGRAVKQCLNGLFSREKSCFQKQERALGSVSLFRLLSISWKWSSSGEGACLKEELVFFWVFWGLWNSWG